MSTLSINARTDAGGTVHIHPTGEIDSDNAHDIRDAVRGVLATGQPRLIKVDMAGGAFIDSVGIGALVSCYHTPAASGGRLRVGQPPPYPHPAFFLSPPPGP